MRVHGISIYRENCVLPYSRTLNTRQRTLPNWTQLYGLHLVNKVNHKARHGARADRGPVDRSGSAFRYIFLSVIFKFNAP